MFWRLILALCGAGATAFIVYAIRPTTATFWIVFAVSFLILAYAWMSRKQVRR